MSQVLVIVPTYNERDNLPNIVAAVHEHLPEADLLIVDDNSPDGTGALADELAAKDGKLHVLHRAGKQGLGTAYVAGFKWALPRGYQFLFEMDCDFSHDPKYLPVMLDLMKLFKGSAPDKTAFEQAHAVFRIQGDRLKVDQLDLIGKAICVGGSGELDLTGDYVKFEFYTVWSQVLKQMINTPLGDLSAFLSKNLFKIKLTRENGELRYRPEPVPVVTEPAKAVADRLKARAAKMTGK